MDQIDGRVGFQQVAPGAFARMGFARHQQHPQPVTHAIDLDHGAVVGQRQLVRAAIDRQFQDSWPGMLQGQRNIRVLADLGQDVVNRAVGEAQFDLGLPARLRALILDMDGDRQRVADDAIAWGAADNQAAVLLVPVTGQQNMHRPGQPGAFHIVGDVMDLPVGKHDDPGQAARRDVGQQACQGVDGLGALVGRRHRFVAQRQFADFQVFVLFGKLLANFVQRFGHPRAPFADSLARRVVNHDRRHILQWIALFLDQ